MAYAAGILPYTFHDGQVFMLLGKDIRDNTWSDFGGKSEAVDARPLDTACREFYEETCGLVIDPKALHVRMAGQTPYSRTYTQHGKTYYMYTLQLPFRPDHRANFRRMLAYMRHIHCFKRKVEKTDIRWVPVDDMLKGTIRLRPVFDNTFHRWWAEHGPGLVRRARNVLASSFKLVPACSTAGVYHTRQTQTASAPYSSTPKQAWATTALNLCSRTAPTNSASPTRAPSKTS